MIMDPDFNLFPGFLPNRLPDQSLSSLPDKSLITVPRFENTCDVVAPNSGLAAHEEGPPEDCDFSDTVLRYISQMLMEEDMEDRACMLQESLDLQAAERSLYEAIGKKYPPSPEPNLAFANGNGEALNHDFPWNYHENHVTGGCSGENSGVQFPGDNNVSSRNLKTLPLSLLSISQSLYSSSNSMVNFTDGLDESPNSTLHIPNLNSENQSMLSFRRGVQEASKFLPSENDLLVSFRVNGSSTQEKIEVAVKEKKKRDNDESLASVLRGRKNRNRDEVDLEEERSSKLTAVFPDSVLKTNVFDKILVHIRGEDSMKEFEALRNQLRNGVEKNIVVSQEGRKTKGSNGTRGRGTRQNGKKQVIDLRTLLIYCAQAVAADDRGSADVLLKQIRQHSSPFGDGNQRLAHCFANGLEARLAGTGSQIYKGFVSKTTSAADTLKAYHLFLACCPFTKVSNFVASKTIWSMAANSTRIHVIDFGILYGFQWPTLIQRLSTLEGGPRRLRITGIEFPQPGFRPAQRVEETGRRLAAYAEEYHVSFEYIAIAKRWDAIQLEELKIDRDEILIVNCLYRAENLHDETVMAESSRNNVLKLIRKIEPDLFIHGVVNAALNAPFFVTRFREALFHFSSIFDMLETIVPREDHERRLLETEVFGREALNVIACEGWERVERPETYKQWQVRNMRSGFVQVPFERTLVKEATHKVKLGYHKDFVIDEDSRWLLQGWKGRIILALSCWKPDSKA